MDGGRTGNLNPKGSFSSVSLSVSTACKPLGVSRSRALTSRARARGLESWAARFSSVRLMSDVEGVTLSVSLAGEVGGVARSRAGGGLGRGERAG